MRYKAAVVALTDDAELRMEFERSLVAKARAHDYDAVASYEFVPDVAELNDRASPIRWPPTACRPC